MLDDEVRQVAGVDSAGQVVPGGDRLAGDSVGRRLVTSQHLPRDRSAVNLVRTIVDLAASLGMTTTAEGVETAEQFMQVRAHGCTEAQGYYFGRPRPNDEVTATLCSDVAYAA